jgi:hypothetical protein
MENTYWLRKFYMELPEQLKFQSQFKLSDPLTGYNTPLLDKEHFDAVRLIDAEDIICRKSKKRTLQKRLASLFLIYTNKDVPVIYQQSNSKFNYNNISLEVSLNRLIFPFPEDNWDSSNSADYRALNDISFILEEENRTFDIYTFLGENVACWGPSEIENDGEIRRLKFKDLKTPENYVERMQKIMKIVLKKQNK